MWVVHKFGGTSVGSAEMYQKVSKLVLDMQPASAQKGIVVSAMKGVTDALIDLVTLARKNDSAYQTNIATLQKKHIDTIQALLPDQPRRQALIAKFESDFKHLEEILRGVWLTKDASERTVEFVSGHGEVWSAQILNALLNEQGHKCDWLDAREVLVVEPLEKSVNVNWEKSADKISHWLGKKPAPIVIITGFVASTVDGTATTLKRNGSDFSASIFGFLLKASEVVIWTDVDGVLSADPRLVPEAVLLNEISYNEVTELAYFGAKVVHPATMEPAIRMKIPIWIRNTFNPTNPGTKIHADAKSSSTVKGFAAIKAMALINVEGSGMVGIPGVAERLFGALRSDGVSVVMISQASSEHSICFAVSEAEAVTAEKAVRHVFFAEIHQGHIQNISVSRGCSILAVVGDNMAASPGVSGKFFTSLGNAGVNIKAIAQGSSERNISAVLDEKDTTRALRAVHAAFYLSDFTISVGLIGHGLIGKAFLGQLQRQAEWLKKEKRIDIRVRAITTSKTMLLDEQGVNLGSLDEKLKGSQSAANMDQFISHAQNTHIPHSVLIDATASEEISQKYNEWFKKGLHVITANKKANTASMQKYVELRETSRKTQRSFLYSTNVGAGLPIIQTLKDLHQTGDHVISIEGIFSGTLSYIFNSFNGAKGFSQIVLEAKQLGYTEPDPRDDLSGTDVARKLIILAREMGLLLELKDVKVQSLIPSALQSVSTDEYLKRLPEFDSEMKKKLDDNKGQILRYVGRIFPNASGQMSASVELSAYPLTHPFSRTQKSDNMVAFRTKRYDAQPLVIQGPGAGPEVTAAGVFADLLKLTAYLGAPS